jgi:uncharacterized membrane protein
LHQFAKIEFDTTQMAYCVHCGSEVTGRFCARCGAPVEGGSPPPLPPTPLSGLQENVASALCYLLLILSGVLFLAMEPYNRNRTVRFHAFQSIFVWIGIVILSIAVAIVSQFWSLIPFAGRIIGGLIWSAFGLGVFVLWIALMYKAYNREKWILPVVGPLAEKQI